MAQPKVNVSLSYVQCVLELLRAKAAREGITLSHAVMRALGPGLGYPSNKFDDDMSKRKKSFVPVAPVTAFLDPKMRELPLNFVDYFDFPRRSSTIYGLLLRVGATWGDGTPITRNEQKQIELWRANNEQPIY